MAVCPAAARSCTKVSYTAMSVDVASRRVEVWNSSRNWSPGLRPEGVSAQFSGTV